MTLEELFDKYGVINFKSTNYRFVVSNTEAHHTLMDDANYKHIANHKTSDNGWVIVFEYVGE